MIFLILILNNNHNNHNKINKIKMIIILLMFSNDFLFFILSNIYKKYFFLEFILI